MDSSPPRTNRPRWRLATIAVATALTATAGLAGASSAFAATTEHARTTTATHDHTQLVDEQAKKAKTKTIKVRMFRFQTETLKVRVGTKVVWKNRDEILHTVSSVDDPASDAAAVIDGELDGVGAKYAVTFTEPGTYDYFCMIHTVMHGRVVVKG